MTSKTWGHADSDLSLGEDSDLKLGPAGSPSDVSLVSDANGSSVDLVADSSADVLGGGGAASDLGFEGSDLGLGSDSDLRLQGDKPKPGGSGVERDLTVSDDEELALGEDDELVLDGGSGVRGTGDTGINLGSPSDSGLNLEEEPLDLAGSSVSSLELPADDEIIELDELEGGAEESTALQADEEFQLSPSAMAPDDEEDSGSQVIALEDSEAFGGVAGALAGADVEPVLGDPGRTNSMRPWSTPRLRR